MIYSLKTNLSSCFLRSNGKRHPTFRLPAAGITLLLSVTCFKNGAHAQTPGSPDTSFGGTGSVSTVIGEGEWIQYSSSVALQPDGKILVGGGRQRAEGDDEFVLVRYHSNGTLDTTFGGGDGMATTAAGAIITRIFGIAVLPDGRIRACGDGAVGQGEGLSYDQFLLGYSAAGLADAAFGSGDGISISNPSSGLDDYLVDMEVQSDGKIVGAGSVVEGELRKPAVMRYLATGDLDTSFSGDGILAITPTALGGDAFDVALQTDGKILVTGNAIVGTGGFSDETDVLVARCNANGTLDPSFGGGDGIVTLRPYPAAAFKGASASQVLVLTDGKILVTGYASAPEGDRTLVAKLLADGSPDTSFGGGTGRVLLPERIEFAIIKESLSAVLPDGKIIVASGQGPFAEFGGAPELVLTRLNADGSLDTQFNAPQGWVVRNPAAVTNDYFNFADMALGSDGTLTVVGDRQKLDETVVAQMVARYHVGAAAVPDALETWQQLHFGTTSNTGTAANDADPNGNGVVNLIEFAMGTPPNAPQTGGLPLPLVTGDSLQLIYTRSKSAAVKVSLSLEWSDSLATASWSVNGVVEQVTGTVGDIETIRATLPAASSGRRFVRLRTTIR